MATTMTSSSSKILQTEFKKLQQQPVEGFTIGLVDDCDIYQWKVGLYGPPDTLYAGGYFKVGFYRYIYFDLCCVVLCNLRKYAVYRQLQNMDIT